MPWGAAIGAVGSIAAAKMSQKNTNGGAGTTTQTKEPWAEAAPWILGNIGHGEALAQQYRDNPFSQQQLQAYANQNAQSDYMRSLVPSLLGQMQAQPAGFDRNNPQAKRANWDWGGFAALPGAGGAGVGGLSSGSMAGATQRQADADAARSAATQAATAAEEERKRQAAAAAAKQQAPVYWNTGYYPGDPQQRTPTY
jgi:hypothetical protein